MASSGNPIRWRLVMKTYDKDDVLPDDYKAALLNLMSFQADSEYAEGSAWPRTCASHPGPRKPIAFRRR